MTSEEHQTLKNIEKLLERILANLDPNRAVNEYGETFSAAIQNSHVRGLRGISTFEA